MSINISSGRKKKKLLLRSTSADQVPRLRALHTSPSKDSDRLSSSLNFDSRLSQRSASLLKELRSEIASLTARHLSKDENFGKDDEELGTDQSDKHYTTSGQGMSDIHPVSGSTVESKPAESDILPNIREKPEPVPDKVDDLPKGTEVLCDSTDVGLMKETPESGFPDDGGEFDFLREETGAFRDPADASREQSELYPDQPDAHGNNGVSQSANEDKTEQDNVKQQSFTMPVFADVEASLSLEDFMDDSLEEHDT